MSDLPEYNGFSNYPTFAVNIWLTSDDATYFDVRGMSADEIEDYVETALSEQEDIAIQSIPESGMFADLLSWAICYIDWQEIADNLSRE